MSASDAVPGSRPQTGRPTATDIVFLVSMVVLTGVIAFLGRMTFVEGLKTESGKARAEALLAWMGEARLERSASGFVPEACAMQRPPGAEPGSWGACARALFATGGPLHDSRNAFSGQSIGLISRCESGDLATAGQIVIDRIAATPPGSAVAFVVTPISSEDRIDQRLNLRITLCDKGGYPIRVGETEF